MVLENMWSHWVTPHHQVGAAGCKGDKGWTRLWHRWHQYMEPTRSWPAHYRSQMAGLFIHGNVSVSLSAISPAWDSLTKTRDASLHAKTRKEQRGRLDEQMACRNKVKKVHERETLSAVAFSVKVRGLCVRWKQKLSAQCVVALLRCETNTKAQNPDFSLRTYSACIHNYLWLCKKRNLICYSTHLFTIYNSKRWCITRSYTFFPLFLLITF